MRQTVLYEAETWILNRNYGNMLEIEERKILRRTYGGLKVDDQWRRRTNDEVGTMFGENKITQEVTQNKSYVEEDMKKWRKK
jgi:hypothetical protein